MPKTCRRGRAPPPNKNRPYTVQSSQSFLNDVILIRLLLVIASCVVGEGGDGRGLVDRVWRPSGCVLSGATTQCSAAQCGAAASVALVFASLPRTSLPHDLSSAYDLRLCWKRNNLSAGVLTGRDGKLPGAEPPETSSACLYRAAGPRPCWTRTAKKRQKPGVEQLSNT